MNRFRELCLIHPRSAIAILLAILFLSGNWILPLADRDEPRFAEASREMRQRGDLVVPWFNGQPRYDKPPLIYWSQIACYQILGETEFAARLPSALFGIATALIIFSFGRRALNAEAGFWSAVVFGTCLQTLVHCRLAVADAAMVCFVALATWSGWELATGKGPAARWQIVFHTSLALGFLAKGPVAWLPLAGVIWAARQGPDGPRTSRLKLGLGIPLMLAAVALWGVPALMSTQGEFFTVGIGRHVVSRTFSVMEGHGSKGAAGYLATLPFFFVTFFASFLPWSPQMAGRLWRRWRTGGRELFGDYLLLQALLFFAVFTLSKTKLPHYTLPAFPCLALWLAGDWLKNGAPARRWRYAGAMVLFTLVVTLGGFSWMQKQFLAHSLYRAAEPHLRPGMALGSVDFLEPSVVWEFRRKLTNYVQHVPPEQIAEFARTNASFIVISRSETAAAQAAALDGKLIRITARGINWSKGNPAEVTAIISP